MRAVHPRSLLRVLVSLIAGSCLLGASPGHTQGEARAELLVSGLQRPLFVAAPSGSPETYAVLRNGTIERVGSGAPTAQPFLDIESRVGAAGEGGLLGLAFAPDFAQSGAFAVYYTDVGGSVVVSLFFVEDDPDVVDPATEQILLTIPQPFANHNGGTVAYGPDGFLWLAPGDGGGAGDPEERAQDPTLLLGKMLRIDPGPVFASDSLPVAGADYRIPADNPFVDDVGVRDEIWALGLRNPYRFSFDRETGDLWIADVGQGQREEIDFEPAGDPGGRNWGWDIMEGTRCVASDPAPAPPCNDPSLTLPIHEYTHSDGDCSVTGGSVYRFRSSPLTGLYFFGDFCTGRIWTLDPATNAIRERSAELGAASAPFTLVGFGEDGVGRLHVVHQSGSIYRILPADPACSDGIDNDGDEAVDLSDPECEGDPTRDHEARCGIGFEMAPVLVAIFAVRRRRAAQSEGSGS